MKKGSIFISIALVVILNLGSQIIWGQRGILAQKELDEQLLELEAHLSHLERSNGILQDRLILLQENPETVSEEAGRLQYIESGEVLIFVRNWDSIKRFSSPEDILHPQLSSQDAKKGRSRIFSLLAGMILCLILLTGPGRKNKKSPPREQGFSQIL